MTELELQNNFINYINKDIKQIYNTDGYTIGLFVEGKLELGSSYGLNKAIKQHSKYIENIKNHGDYLPKYFYAYEANGRGYLYEMSDTFDLTLVKELNWQINKKELNEYINLKQTIKYNVDNESILGLANNYYSNNITANKTDFFDNYITKPNDKFNEFKGTIDQFSQIMDKLNDKITQKTLGAFYTPEQYVNYSTDLVRRAIINIEAKKKKWIIIDRCTGTGNLESLFNEKELKNTIMNTYEAQEWLVLKIKYDGKAIIIPNKYIVKGTLLENGDALDPNWLDNNKDIFDNILKEQKEGKLEIILLENPPYMFVCGDYKGDQSRTAKKQENQKGDLCINFLKTALEQIKPDHLILFSPIKYWKVYNMIDTKYFEKGYICNRKHFHATIGGISLIYWNFTEGYYKNDYIELINDNYEWIKVKKIKNRLKTGLIRLENINTNLGALGTQSFEPDFKNQGLANTKQDIKGNILKINLGTLGTKSFEPDFKNQGLANDKEQIKHKGVITNLGYMGICSFEPHYTHQGLANTEQEIKPRTGKYKLETSNIFQNLPLWASYLATFTNYWDKNIIFCNWTNFDYLKDEEFLTDVAIYTLFTKNNWITIQEFYQFILNNISWKDKKNEKDISKLFDLWNLITKETNFNEWGIKQQMNYDTFNLNDKNKKVYEKPLLHNFIITLNELTNNFYKTYILPKLFEYELLI